MSAIRTPPANDAYRDNFDAIFKGEKHKTPMQKAIHEFSSTYQAGWNDAITQVLEILNTNHVHIDGPVMIAILAARK